MRVLVTGGSGQLGSLVLRRLIDDRRVKKIVSLDVVPPTLCSAKLDARIADVRDYGLASHFEGVDAVFHLAFVVTGKKHREIFEAINIGGSQNVFRAAAAKNVPHLIYASSVAAYGVYSDHGEPIVESTPRRRQVEFPYAFTKFEVEAFLDAFEVTHPEMKIARMRPAILIGTRFGNPLGRILGQALDAGYLVLGGDAPLPMVWDEDVADAAMTILERGASGPFILGAEAQSPRELAEKNGLRLVAPPSSVLKGAQALSLVSEKLRVGDPVDPSWSKFGDVRMIFSSARAHAELGWKPKCVTSAEVIGRYLTEAPGAPSRKTTLFLRTIDLASRTKPPEPDMQGLSGRVHLALLGKGGGDFSLSVDGGRLRIAPGIPRPPTSAATMKIEVFHDLLAGRLDFATAQLTGKVRLEGDTGAGFVIGGVVRRFRNQTEAEGWRGTTARRFARWVTGGAA